MKFTSINEKSARFHIIACLICIFIGVLSSIIYIRANYKVSFSSPAFVAQSFMRMVRDTQLEESLGGVIFSPQEPRHLNSIATTKKRTDYNTALNNLIWNKAISSSTPLLFLWKSKLSPHIQMSDVSCNVGNDVWIDLDSTKELDVKLMSEHSHFKEMLTPVGGVQQIVNCPKSTVKGQDGIDVSDSTIPFMKLKQLMHEEYLCNIGMPSETEPRIHVIAINPFHTDYMLPIEGKTRKNNYFLQTLYESHFKTSWNKHPSLVKKQKEKRKKFLRNEAEVFELQGELPTDDPLYDRLPDSKHGVLKRGDCIFLPSFWWIYMEIENPAAQTRPMQLTRSRYKTHSAFLEVFIRTMRENIRNQ